MDRFEICFQQKVFAAYLTAGDGDSEGYFLALLRGGVNLLEIGIPYSDPVADGPVIQKAMQRALASGTTLEKVLQLVSKLRAKTDAPVVLFTYFNPIHRNLRSFLLRAKEAGADGILIVDLPYEEAEEYRALCDEANLAPIFVITPSTPEERIGVLGRAGKGFLYYACRKGVTGERSSLPPDIQERLRLIKQTGTLPVIAGFGIANKEDVSSLLQIADGCVIGSAFVRAVGARIKPEQLERMCCDFRP